MSPVSIGLGRPAHPFRWHHQPEPRCTTSSFLGVDPQSKPSGFKDWLGLRPHRSSPLAPPRLRTLGCLRTRHSAALGCLRPLARRSGPRPLRRRAFLRSSARGRARRRPAPRPCRPSSVWWSAMGECAVPSLRGGGAGRRLRGKVRRGGADRRGVLARRFRRAPTIAWPRALRGRWGGVKRKLSTFLLPRTHLMLAGRHPGAHSGCGRASPALIPGWLHPRASHPRYWEL